MRVNRTKYYAVISGDFIGFSHLPIDDRKSMYFILKNGGRALADTFPGVMPLEVDMFRGDGWQMLLTDPLLSLRAALYFRACIRSKTKKKNINSRMAIAVGRIDYVPENKVSAGDGTAFRLSGKLLEKMNRATSATMRFTMEDKKKSTFLDRTVQKAGAPADRWTSSQAMVIMDMLKGWTQDQISVKQPEKTLNPTMARLLNRAGWPEIHHALSVFEPAVPSKIL